MKSEHLVGTSIPRFTYDTPTVPKNDFYALCEGEQPLVMIFLPSFNHPVSREYITRYLKTLSMLKGIRLACVVRSSPQTVAAATRGNDFPFTVICDEPGVLYSYLGVEQTRGILSWSFAAQRIFKAARDAGYQYDRNAPQILPLTLVVGPKGQILFTHSGRSQTDLPEDCRAIREIVQQVQTAAAAQRSADPNHSDETLTLPDLMGVWEDGEYPSPLS
ncbi:MAG: AhpC/TSA family protein [Faecalibacterium sp.]